MRFYIYKNNQNEGPLEELEVVAGLRNGRFVADDLGCRVGESEWRDLSFLFPLETAPPPAPAPQIVYEPPPAYQQASSLARQTAPIYQQQPMMISQPQVAYQPMPMGFSSNSDVGKLMMYESNKKSTGIAYLLWFFLGMFGAHRFYIGETGTGVAILLITICSILLKFVLIGFVTIFISIFWVFIDLFLIPSLVQKHNSRLASRLNFYG